MPPASRLASQLSPGLLQIGATLVLTSPFTPMLFMGEEWGASTPWQYFTDHDDPELAQSVSDGRRREFVKFGWNPTDVPDPQDPATFERSRLDWLERDKDDNAVLLAYYQRLIRLRRAEPDLTDPMLSEVTVVYDEEHRWIAVRRGSLVVLANLAPVEQRLPTPAPVIDVLLSSTEGFMFDSDTVTVPAESAAIARMATGAA